jgi:hypothetical protein
MELTTDVKKLNAKLKTRFCPYRGEYDWQIECLSERCMKFNAVDGSCGRS